MPRKPVAGGVWFPSVREVTDGEVSVDQDFALTREERAKGWVLCCQAKPRSNKLSLSFKEDR